MPQCPHCPQIHDEKVLFCPSTGKAISVSLVAEGAIVAGKYRVLRRLASGGMGAIYEVEHVGFGKHFAMKLLLPELAQNLEVTARFEREAKAASAIGHPNIIEITDVGETDAGLRFIVMELLVGEDLATVLKRHGRLPTDRAVELTAQVLLGLQAAHAAGIVHRDLKPENVFVCRSPTGGEAVKLLDFGISKIAGSDEAKLRLTSTGLILGTPYYMSPEQAKGARDVDHRADLYSVVVLLYEALTGQRPYVAENLTSLIFQIINGQVPPPRTYVPDLPEDLENVVLTALANDPSVRFQSAAEFREALIGERVVPRPALVSGARDRVPTPQDGFLPTLPTGARTPVSLTGAAGQAEAGEAPRRRTGLVVAVGLLLAAAIGLGAWLTLRPKESSRGGAEASAGGGARGDAPGAARPGPDGGAAGDRAPPGRDRVRITVAATPATAALLLDGKAVAENPFYVPRTGQKHVLEVRAPGHRPRTLSFQADESQRLVVALDREDEPDPRTGGAGRAAPRHRTRTRTRPRVEPRPEPRVEPRRKRIETTTDI